MNMLINRYQASLPDELDLRPGMKLRVLRLYDDAWGTAQIVSGAMEGERTEGSFPIVRIHTSSFPHLCLRIVLIGRYVFRRDLVLELLPLGLVKDPLISLRF
jgi:hypothetical protein